MPRILHGIDMPRQDVLNLITPISSDKGDFPDLLIGVHDIQQLLQLLLLHRRSHLDPNWILNPAEVLHMRSIKLAGTVTDPDEMTGGIIPLRLAILGIFLLAGQALLVLEKHAFVRCVKVNSAQTRGVVGADGTHEADGVRNGVHDLLVLLLCVVIVDVTELPLEGVVEISEARRKLGANVVQGGCGVEVGASNASACRTGTESITHTSQAAQGQASAPMVYIR